MDSIRVQEEVAAQVRSRHYVDWVLTLDELGSAKRDDEALALLMEITPAAERVAAITGLEPAPGYTTRAAIILRRREYAGEVEILERYLNSCPPDRRGGKVADRLVKAKQLAAGD